VRILRTIRSLDPAAGGPPQHVRMITPELARLGVDTEVVTLDPPDAPWLADLPCPVHALGGRGGYGATPALPRWVREHRARFDAAFVHGLWLFNGHGFAVGWRGTGQPYYVLPHGMLDPWFRQAYPLKHYKKQLYWWWREARLLHEAAAVLFTAEEERRLARGTFRPYHVREHVIPYGITEPPAPHPAQRAAFAARCPDLGDRPCLLFLGRLHDKKGVDLLLRAYGRFAASPPPSGEPIPDLVLAGPFASAAYEDTVRRLAAEIGAAGPLAGRIHFPGPLAGDAKWGAFRRAAAFVLPSHQENFGIAVAEALACGLPVLISNKVNIWREIEAAGAGLVAPDTVEGTLSLLTRWRAAVAEPGSPQPWSQRARAAFATHFRLSATAAELVRILHAPPSVVRPATP
jgi:glycosyltransferase involved in cell wall biosynthesis